MRASRKRGDPRAIGSNQRSRHNIQGIHASAVLRESGANVLVSPNFEQRYFNSECFGPPLSLPDFELRLGIPNIT
jgi:hypothetical protein